MTRKILTLALAVAAAAGTAFSQSFTFSQKNSYSVGTAPGSIVTADFNGDGKADLATMDIISFTVTVLMGNGDGTFRALSSYASPCQPVHMTVGGFTTPGTADLLIAG